MMSNTLYNMIIDCNKTDKTFTNYNKADWIQLTAFAQTTIPTNIYTVNKIFINIILMTDKHNIPKGKMHSNCRVLPDHIVCTITNRNNMRRANTSEPALKLLNAEITEIVGNHFSVKFLSFASRYLNYSINNVYC